MLQLNDVLSLAGSYLLGSQSWSSLGWAGLLCLLFRDASSVLGLMPFKL